MDNCKICKIDLHQPAKHSCSLNCPHSEPKPFYMAINDNNVRGPYCEGCVTGIYPPCFHCNKSTASLHISVDKTDLGPFYLLFMYCCRECGKESYQRVRNFISRFNPDFKTTKECHGCHGLSDKMFRCSRCKQGSYCSIACQKKC